MSVPGHRTRAGDIVSRRAARFPVRRCLGFLYGYAGIPAINYGPHPREVGAGFSSAEAVILFGNAIPLTLSDGQLQLAVGLDPVFVSLTDQSSATIPS